jgi:hypothetical protein
LQPIDDDNEESRIFVRISCSSILKLHKKAKHENLNICFLINLKSIVWSEALLAAIGEQLSDCVASKDEIIGISVGRRDKEDIVQIWNLNAKYETEASVCSKMQHLLPNVKFSVVFYKGKTRFNKIR